MVNLISFDFSLAHNSNARWTLWGVFFSLLLPKLPKNLPGLGNDFEVKNSEQKDATALAKTIERACRIWFHSFCCSAFIYGIHFDVLNASDWSFYSRLWTPAATEFWRNFGEAFEKKRKNNPKSRAMKKTTEWKAWNVLKMQFRIIFPIAKFNFNDRKHQFLLLPLLLPERKR